MGASLAVWLASGLLAWTGASSFAELGSSIPVNGGAQAYLQYSYGPLVSYLFAWTAICALKPGTFSPLWTALDSSLREFLVLARWQCCNKPNFCGIPESTLLPYHEFQYIPGRPTAVGHQDYGGNCCIPRYCHMCRHPNTRDQNSCGIHNGEGRR